MSPGGSLAYIEVKVKTWYVRGMKATRNEQINNQIDVDICIEEDACLGVQIQSLSRCKKELQMELERTQAPVPDLAAWWFGWKWSIFWYLGTWDPKTGDKHVKTPPQGPWKKWKNELEQRTRAFSICTYKMFLLFVISSFTDDTFSKEQSICDNSWFCEHTSL